MLPNRMELRGLQHFVTDDIVWRIETMGDRWVVTELIPRPEWDRMGEMYDDA